MCGPFSATCHESLNRHYNHITLNVKIFIAPPTTRIYAHSTVAIKPDTLKVVNIATNRWQPEEETGEFRS
jgi:hypothetical protein